MPGLFLWLKGYAFAAEPRPFTADVQQGERYDRRIGADLYLRLVPQRGGWGIEVGPAAGVDFAGVVTPPFHGPNPLAVQAWHFTPAGKAIGLGEGAKRRFQFVLTRDALWKEERALEAMLYSNDIKAPDHVRGMAEWGTDRLGTCWMTPQRVMLTQAAGARVIQSMRFSAACRLDGGNHYVQYLP